tara:strand:+ start:265 stop:435 length:171 start_codon:yes stop_codon:yes gene_type:complete
MIRKKSKKGRYHLIDNDTNILIGIFPSYKSAMREVDMLLDNEIYREIKIIHERKTT